MPDLLERISVDPAVCGGRPCIRGHRIWVSLILGFLAEGATVKEVLDEYPQLEEADVRALHGLRFWPGRRALRGRA